MYRIKAFGSQTALEVVLAAQGGGAYIAVLDWHGGILAETTGGGPSPELNLLADLPVPGVYGVLVKGLPTAGSVTYKLSSKLGYAVGAATPLWPTALATGDGPL